MAATPLFDPALRDALAAFGARAEVWVPTGAGPHPWDGLDAGGAVARGVPAALWGAGAPFGTLPAQCRGDVAPGGAQAWSAGLTWSATMTFTAEGIIP